MYSVRVECTKTDMVITLAFGYPFNGRVYVNGNYQVKKINCQTTISVIVPNCFYELH